jgi:tRNA(adenine34) deaminase
MLLNPYNDDYFMKQALLEAKNAFEEDEVPVGAVIVCKNQIIARGHNLTETLTDVTAHAEIQAITAASQYLGAKYLKGCTLYVTVEPCCMCAGALFWAQIDKIVFGARDEKRGAGKMGQSLYHPSTLVVNGIMEAECSQLMKDFFAKKRG